MSDRAFFAKREVVFFEKEPPEAEQNHLKGEIPCVVDTSSSGTVVSHAFHGKN